MEKKPLVSYVLTAYNIEDFIEESIKCAFAQAYEPLEIVLSDDHSTDRTFEIMKTMAAEYKGPHKVVLNRNEKNMGITKHMNKAYLELASGEIIIAAHGDDLSEPDRTAVLVDFLLKNREYTAVSSGIKIVNSDGKEMSKNCVGELRTYTLADPESGGIPNIPAPSRAFYKKVMTEFGPLQPSCPTEDELISFRSLLLGKNAFIPDILVSYRKHDGSSSNPENFDKFPLEKISEQKFLDMELAVQKGLLTEEKRMSLLMSKKRV